MKFAINEKVKAAFSVQGLIENDIYTITKVISDSTPFGTFVTYFVTCEARQRSGAHDLRIGNGHLVLSKVGA